MMATPVKKWLLRVAPWFLPVGIVAAAGADLGFALNGAPAPLLTAVRVRPGDEISFAGPRGGGCRGYGGDGGEGQGGFCWGGWGAARCHGPRTGVDGLLSRLQY